MATDTATMEPELRKWNWGAFLLTWIWAFGHRRWLFGILGLIPLVSLVMWILFGMKGNRWAWESGDYAGLEDFRRRERRWAIAGAIVWGLGAVLWILAVALGS